MAAISDNKYDVYNWIIKVINSCKSHQQIDTVNRLITNFRDIHEDWELTKKLKISSNCIEFKIKNNL